MWIQPSIDSTPQAQAQLVQVQCDSPTLTGRPFQPHARETHATAPTATLDAPSESFAGSSRIGAATGESELRILVKEHQLLAMKSMYEALSPAEERRWRVVKWQIDTLRSRERSAVAPSVVALLRDHHSLAVELERAIQLLGPAPSPRNQSRARSR